MRHYYCHCIFRAERFARWSCHARAQLEKEQINYAAHEVIMPEQRSLHVRGKPTGSRNNLGSRIDASLSRPPLLRSGYEVNAVMQLIRFRAKAPEVLQALQLQNCKCACAHGP